jgi:hypothetical protein
MSVGAIEGLMLLPWAVLAAIVAGALWSRHRRKVNEINDLVDLFRK